MTSHRIDKTNSNPAYHLAVGSAGTANDIANRMVIDGGLKAEVIWLGENFIRIAELLSADDTTDETASREAWSRAGLLYFLLEQHLLSGSLRMSSRDELTVEFAWQFEIRNFPHFLAVNVSLKELWRMGNEEVDAFAISLARQWCDRESHEAKV